MIARCPGDMQNPSARRETSFCGCPYTASSMRNNFSSSNHNINGDPYVMGQTVTALIFPPTAASEPQKTPTSQGRDGGDPGWSEGTT